MRKLWLSVCVGLLVSACEGAVDGAAEVEDSEAGANQQDAAASDAGRGDAGQLDAGKDAATSGQPDSAAPHDAGGDARAPDASSGGNPDASSGGGPDASGGAPDAGGGGNKGKPVFVVAGYSYGIAFSTDLGQHWTTVQGPNGPPADNEFVLSGAGYSNGTFVVAGWDLFSSTDGEHWSPRTNPSDQWLGNVTVGLGLFVGVGGNGTSLWSEDGITWHKGTSLGSDGFDTSAFGGGEFRATSKGGQWWRSTDGKSWTKMNGESGHSAKIIWCVDHFADEDDCNTLVPNGQTAFGENVWIRVENNTQIRRSTNNGQSWTNASVNFDANAVAFGYVQ